MNVQDLLTKIIEWCTSTGIKIIVAIIILIVAFKIINAVTRKLGKRLADEKKLDPTIVKPLMNFLRIGLKVLVAICLIGFLGFDVGGLSAVVASLGIGIGLAVNGTLANLAGGVLLLVTRPFSIGDFISAQGSDGVVEDISICYTRIVTVDNRTVYLPNAALANGTIENYSAKDLRRVDLDFSVAGNDPSFVRNTLLDICDREELVVKDPATFARITDFGAGNGVKVTLMAWCKSGDYWDCRFNILDAAQKVFEEKGIVIPFNQLDVHIKQ